MLPILLFAAGCEDAGHIAAKAVPALEKVDPSWGSPRVDCEEQRTPPKPVRGCVVEKVQCGDVIEGTTVGGPNNFGDDFFQGAYCTPQRNNYENSPEAVYQLRLEGNVKAVLRVDSNCADLDPFAFNWSDSRCPTDQHRSNIRECEFDDKPGGGTIVLTTVDNPQTYMIGVDGKQGAAANFRMTIECSLYR